MTDRESFLREGDWTYVPKKRLIDVVAELLDRVHVLEEKQRRTEGDG